MNEEFKQKLPPCPECTEKVTPLSRGVFFADSVKYGDDPGFKPDDYIIYEVMGECAAHHKIALREFRIKFKNVEKFDKGFFGKPLKVIISCHIRSE